MRGISVKQRNSVLSTVAKAKRLKFLWDKPILYTKNFIQPFQATTCFKILVLDFSIGAIEMICGLLESCGRFLYRNGDSHQKTKLLLDQLKKKKQAKALDARLNSQVGIKDFEKFKNPLIFKNYKLTFF